MGNPADENTNIGAVVSQPHFNKILKHITIAKEEGGKILAGGKPITLDGSLKNGFYIEPTVVENLPLVCSTNEDEIFGPVVTLNKFETEEEVIALANDILCTSCKFQPTSQKIYTKKFFTNAFNTNQNTSIITF